VAANADFVAVADTFNNRVQVFRGDTLAHVRTIGGTAAGSGDGEFDAPRGVALDDRDRIWVCDTGNNRVQVLSIDGVLSFEFGRRGAGDGQFEGPRGIAVVGNRSDGYRIYVADTLNDRVQKFTLPARA
jgi:DNA-binding beta-propeller fold protein YncE